MKNSAYICSTQAEGVVIQSLADKLIKLIGDEIYVSEDDSAGGLANNWADIKTCNCFIFIKSSSTVNSQRCQQELVFASEKGKKIIIVEVDQTTVPQSISRVIQNNEIISFSEPANAIMDKFRKFFGQSDDAVRPLADTQEKTNTETTAIVEENVVNPPSLGPRRRHVISNVSNNIPSPPPMTEQEVIMPLDEPVMPQIPEVEPYEASNESMSDDTASSELVIPEQQWQEMAMDNQKQEPEQPAFDLDPPKTAPSSDAVPRGNNQKLIMILVVLLLIAAISLVLMWSLSPKKQDSLSVQETVPATTVVAAPVATVATIPETTAATAPATTVPTVPSTAPTEPATTTPTEPVIVTEPIPQITESTHTHSWREATCTTSSVCEGCGESVGIPLGHKWRGATCTESSVCEVCGESAGRPLGHDWLPATCSVPNTCRICDATQGEALNHDWQPATYTAPKTCIRCGLTDGDVLPSSVYLNERPFAAKYGKLWTRSDSAPDTYYHTKVDHPNCWSDMDTLGHTQGAVRDIAGNAYIYGMHLDGADTGTYYITYNLDGNYSTFSGVCAYPESVISVQWAPQYTKQFRVYGDGMLIFTSVPMNKYTPAAAFSINVSGVKELRIEYPATEGPNEVATLFDGKLE